MDVASWTHRVLSDRREKDHAFRFDPHSPIPPAERAAFKGLRYFDPDTRYRFEAKLVPGPAQRLMIERSGGDEQEYMRVGHFELHLPLGPARLALYQAKLGGHWFLPLRDATSGNETYGAGRYVEPEPLGEGRFLLDFNGAYHPYCAYNEAFSCPFVPPENHLTIPVRAGERL